MFGFLRQIRTHPIYLREKGQWGQANRYYRSISNYLWLLIFALPVLFISNSLSPATLFSGNGMPSLYLLACLPNLVVQVITWIGLIMAPAMTAPAIVNEMNQGSWEILRLTPIKTHEIVLAKLLGGLAHLKIWWPLLFISTVQALIFLGAIFFSIFSGSDLLSIGSGLLGFATLILRPWVEIGFAGLLGITLSLWMGSARAALITTYSGVVAGKIFLSNGLFALFGFLLFQTGGGATWAGLVLFGPILIYALLAAILLFLIFKRSAQLEAG